MVRLVFSLAPPGAGRRVSHFLAGHDTGAFFSAGGISSEDQVAARDAFTEGDKDQGSGEIDLVAGDILGDAMELEVVTSTCALAQPHPE